MNKVLIAMAFWDDGKETKTRHRNCQFAYKMMQSNLELISKTKVSIDFKLFDFSPVINFEHAIHIPYPLAEYRRCEKLNEIIFKHAKDYDVICIVDSDAFFLPADVLKFEELLANVDPNANHHYLFSLHDIDHVNVNRINFEELYVPSNIHTTDRYQGGCGTFGGWFVSPLKSIKDVGGYSEHIKTWGGEDGDLYMKLDAVKPFGYTKADIKIYHLSHDTDWGNPKYYK